MYEPKGANSFYRAVIPLQELERRGHSVVWPTAVSTVPMREFLGCDLVHCYRRLDRMADLRKLSEHGVAVSFDNDDNFEAVEMSNRGGGLKAHLHNQEAFREILSMAQLADLTTTPSELLAERYRQAGARHVAVIENHLSREMLSVDRVSKRDKVVVGWVAAREHKLDLDRLPIVQSLKRLLETHPEMRLLTIGVRLPLHSERYEHVPKVPFHDLLQAIGGVEIGIAPLADTAFNRSRSNVKLKEYGSVGAAWLASPLPPYLGLGEKQGGQLVSDGGWFAAIDELLHDERKRKRLAKRALKWATTQTIERFASTWENEFRAAIQTAERRTARSR
jgi:glycosyltransferase involved in cell wall biosynthesis